MTEFHSDEVVTFEFERTILQRFGDNKPIWNLTGQEVGPKRCNSVRMHRLSHVLDNWWSRYCSSLRKPIEDQAEPKVVIAVPVGDIDRREVLSGGGYPTGKDLCLCRGHQWVDEHSVAFAGDER